MEIKKYGYLSFIIVSVFILSASANHYFKEYINSDALYLFETAKNLIQTKTLAGQNFPIAAYFFPDLMLLMGLNTFSHNITVLHYMYSCLFLITYFFIIYQLFYTSLRHSDYALLGTVCVIIGCFFLIAPPFSFLQDWQGSHLSVLLMSLTLLILYIKWAELHWWHYGVLFILLYLMFISDKLIFVQLMVPLAGLAIIDKERQKKNAMALCVLFLCVIFFGVFTDKWLCRYGQMSVSFNASLFRIRHFHEVDKKILIALQLLKETLKRNPWIYVELFFLTVLSVSLCLLLYFKKQNAAFGNLWRIVGFLYLAELSNVVLGVLAGKFSHLEHIRYFAPLYFFPVIASMLLCVHCVAIRLYSKWIYFFLSGLAVVGVFSFGNQQLVSLRTFNLKPPYTESIQCLDNLTLEYPIQNGLGDYWHARLVRALSKKGLRMTQVDKNLNLVNYLDNILFFYTDRDLKKRPTYQFIIVDNLKTSLILQRVGAPNVIVHCQTLTAWLYLTPNQRLNQTVAQQKVLEY